ncbi:MAG: LptF/LptG family permease [Opitutaceae bacterium]
MTLFDRYLLREWFQIIGLVIAALLGLLMVNVLYTDLPPLLQADATLVDVLVYIGVTIPSFLSLLLPLTLLVSVLYVFGQMHKNHEFTAMRAAGVSLLRISMPVWCIGLICCGVSWWLNSGIVPWSTERSRMIREQLEFRQQSGVQGADRIGAVNSVSFDNRRSGRMWFINRYSKFTQKAYGLTLSYLDVFRHEKRRLVAAQAWRKPDGAGWILRQGRELIFDTSTGEVVRNRPFAEMACPELDEDAGLMLLIDRKPIDLSFWELARLIDHLEDTRSPTLSKYAVRYQSLLADTLAPLIVIGLSIPFAVSGVRVNPAVGMSKSIGLFVLYYLFAQLGGSLAAKGLLTPVEAAWLPSLAMVALAAWLVVRLR